MMLSLGDVSFSALSCLDLVYRNVLFVFIGDLRWLETFNMFSFSCMCSCAEISRAGAMKTTSDVSLVWDVPAIHAHVLSGV